MTKNRGFKVRDLRNKQFFVVDDIYLNGYARLLGAIASVVYFSLCRHADKDQLCFPSQKLIAEEFSIGERTVRDKLRLLEKCKIIRRIREKDNKGRWINNTYILLDKSEWLPKEEVAKILGISYQEEIQRQPLPVDNPEANDCYIQRQPLPLKDTHIKYTHNNIERGIPLKDRKQLLAVRSLTSKPKKTYSSLDDIREEDLQEISNKYRVSVPFVRFCLEKMTNWLEAKGKRYKNYKRALMNWVLSEAQRQVGGGRKGGFVDATEI